MHLLPYLVHMTLCHNHHQGWHQEHDQYPGLAGLCSSSVDCPCHGSGWSSLPHCHVSPHHESCSLETEESCSAPETACQCSHPSCWARPACQQDQCAGVWSVQGHGALVITEMWSGVTMTNDQDWSQADWIRNNDENILSRLTKIFNI